MGEIVVGIGGILVIIFVAWFFFREKKEGLKASSAGNQQRVGTVVNDGYHSHVIRVKKRSILIAAFTLAFLLVGCQAQDQKAASWEEWDSLTPAQRSVAEEITNAVGPCPCRQCAETLTDCHCDHAGGALEIKTAIAKDIKAGYSKDKILAGLQKKYSLDESEQVPEPIHK